MINAPVFDSLVDRGALSEGDQPMMRSIIHTFSMVLIVAGQMTCSSAAAIE
jgi:hypothetical protein